MQNYDDKFFVRIFLSVSQMNFLFSALISIVIIQLQ